MVFNPTRGPIVAGALALGLAACAQPATDACAALEALLLTANEILAVDNSPKVAHLKQDVALAEQMVAAGCANPQALDALIAQMQGDLQAAQAKPQGVH